VLVPVTVTDAMDRPITALPRRSFRVLEDGAEQTIVSFSREDGPVSLGILFDTSGSMKSRMSAAVAALREFFLTTILGDEFFLVRFSDEARLLTGFTPKPDEIFGTLGFVEAKGWTALFDSIALGAHKMRSAKHSRRILLIISDGGDNNSRFSESEIRNMVLESDLRIYAIGVFHHPRLLKQLAEDTGGRTVVAESLAELPDIVHKLSAEIRSQYLLGYTPSVSHNDGKYRKVKVELVEANSPPLRVYWRRGYYSPIR
jgi:VWFA-related protein